LTAPVEIVIVAQQRTSEIKTPMCRFTHNQALIPIATPHMTGQISKFDQGWFFRTAGR
jgi:hypothetical protein